MKTQGLTAETRRRGEKHLMKINESIEFFFVVNITLGVFGLISSNQRLPFFASSRWTFMSFLDCHTHTAEWPAMSFCGVRLSERPNE
jgi:hypothetical protein